MNSAPVLPCQPGSDEYQPRTAERLVEILRARSEVPRSIDREAAAIIEQLPALKSRVEEQDRLLAEAADFLNRASRLDAMDLGAVITAYRLKQQRSVAMPLEQRGDK